MRIAVAIKAARGRRSAQWLADRTVELGYPITRAQIANYESGRKRSLDIAELVVLAVALDTSPVVLMYPDPRDDQSNLVEALPGVELTGFQAAQWVSGLGYWEATELNEPGADVSSDNGREWVDNTRTLRLSRELESVERTRSLLAKHAKNDDDRRQILFYDSQIQWFRNELGLSQDA